jgi:hypothetical protein
MPTDQSHIIAFFVALSAIAVLGVVAFVYIWLTTAKRTEQEAFDFTPQPRKSASKKTQAPPMAHV